MAALSVATAATSSADVGTLFWAILFSPVLIFVVKLQGLYDNDHRRIRHSTLDELPALVSASALGTLALDGLLALSPAAPSRRQRDRRRGRRPGRQLRAACRAPLRLAPAAGVATGLVVGPALAADLVARRVLTHPEARLRAGRLPLLLRGDASPGGLPRLGEIADSPGSPRSSGWNG